MARHRDREQPGPAQRQLRVGELIRHALAEMLIARRDRARSGARGAHRHGPGSAHVARTCKLATVYVMPLGGARRKPRSLAALERNKQLSPRRDRPAGQPEVRARPPLPVDERFDEAARIDELLALARGARAISTEDRPEAAMNDGTRGGQGATCHGWLILDKAVGMTSTAGGRRGASACSDAQKAGHAGTLDPLATGMLPIALGEATKTVPFVMDGRKAYRFTVRWGAETDTDDAEGTRADDERRAARPRARSSAALPAFTGEIAQVPPRFSAIKVDGERAYDLARDGEDGRARGAAGGRSTSLSLIERARRGPRGVRGRVRQGHLCARARPRSRPRARLSRPRGSPAPHPRRPVRRARRGDARAIVEARASGRDASCSPLSQAVETGLDGAARPECQPCRRATPACAASPSSCAAATPRSCRGPFRSRRPALWWRSASCTKARSSRSASSTFRAEPIRRISAASIVLDAAAILCILRRITRA